ncbi:MAG: hypothetical protein FWD98_07975, partial [Defluviitaleaceae bacterium]|nr:hypothetical protein [Defluviitaleaceae bacterium]
GERITIADLDVLNPYFRSREKAEELHRSGIDVFGGSLGNNNGQDVPHIDYGFLSRISAGERVIVDLAGGVMGLHTLPNVYDRLRDYEFLAVLNLYRPETNTADKMLNFIGELHSASRIRITGCVHNSHMLSHTTLELVLDAQDAVADVCARLDVPLRYTLLDRKIYEQVSGQLVSDEALVFDRLQLREAWQ